MVHGLGAQRTCGKLVATPDIQLIRWTVEVQHIQSTVNVGLPNCPTKARDPTNLPMSTRVITHFCIETGRFCGEERPHCESCVHGFLCSAWVVADISTPFQAKLQPLWPPPSSHFFRVTRANNSAHFRRRWHCKLGLLSGSGTNHETFGGSEPSGSLACFFL